MNRSTIIRCKMQERENTYGPTPFIYVEDFEEEDSYEAQREREIWYTELVLWMDKGESYE